MTSMTRYYYNITDQLMIIMTYISLDADVRVGDLVVTSGTTETFPKGLLIGEIADVFEAATKV